MMVLFIFILLFFIEIIMYFIIRGSSMNKTDTDKKREFEEQAEYFRNYESKKLNEKMKRKMNRKTQKNQGK